MLVRTVRVLALTLAAGLGLGACDREDQRALRSDARKLAEDARTAVRDTARKVQQDTKLAAQSLRRHGETARQIAADATIAARVKAAVVAEKNVKSADIRVEAFQGRVMLRGTVPDEEQIALAARVARKVDGVQSVDNRLAVD